MERLTNIGSNGEIWITDNDETRKFGRKETAYKKLAEYEDFEEQGLLLRLPCKVGNTLYKVYKKPTKCTPYGEYKDDYVCEGCEEYCDSSYVWDIYKYKADIKTIVCLSEEIGKTVFLTQEEAEQKLKEKESMC